MFNEKTIFMKAKPFTEEKIKDQLSILEPGISTIPNGFQYDERFKPTQVDIIFEKDVAVKMRDGVTIYVDILRPAGQINVPVIISWSPYGKDTRNSEFYTQLRKMTGVDDSKLSGLMKWEGADPDCWCAQGYAVCHPDARGSFMSEGTISVFGNQEGEDGHDLVEWLATQEWCNGKIGLAGNSWLAAAQWFIAAEQPPHLAAIAPWEGFSDLYRDIALSGGINDSGFIGDVNKGLKGSNMAEDLVSATIKYPLMNDYWEGKIAKYDKITVPAYVVSSYSNTVHTSGTFRAWQNIAAKDKWLRIHNLQEWPDFYKDENQEDLKKFFDFYLKGISNDWMNTPSVRYSLLDFKGGDITNIPASQFPPENVEQVTYYLDDSTLSLSENNNLKESSVSYDAENKNGKVEFVITFNQDIEIVGHPKVKLWVEAENHNDMDIFVFLQKLNKNGEQLSVLNVPKNDVVDKALPSRGATVLRYTGSNGRLKVSMRHIDESKSTKWIPYFPFDKKDLLKPGEIVQVEIPMLPIGMIFNKGEKLRLVVSGHNLMGGQMPNTSEVVPDNKGKHIIHTGGKYNSNLELQILKRV